jgi:hypothetical protein
MVKGMFNLFALCELHQIYKTLLDLVTDKKILFFSSFRNFRNIAMNIKKELLNKFPFLRSKMAKYIITFSIIRRVALLTFIIFFYSCANAQVTSGFYSNQAQKLYNELIELNTKTDWTNLNSLVTPEMKKRYNIYEEDDDLWVDAKFVIDEESYDDQELWNNGIKVGTRINDEVEVKIPLHAYLVLTNIFSLEYVELKDELLLPELIR